MVNQLMKMSFWKKSLNELMKDIKGNSLREIAL
jgi:hypothetical protein